MMIGWIAVLCLVVLWLSGFLAGFGSADHVSRWLARERKRQDRARGQAISYVSPPYAQPLDYDAMEPGVYARKPQKPQPLRF